MNVGKVMAREPDASSHSHQCLKFLGALRYNVVRLGQVLPPHLRVIGYGIIPGQRPPSKA